MIYIMPINQDNLDALIAMGYTPSPKCANFAHNLTEDENIIFDVDTLKHRMVYNYCPENSSIGTRPITLKQAEYLMLLISVGTPIEQLKAMDISEV
jgi:hypothetical protein